MIQIIENTQFKGSNLTITNLNESQLFLIKELLKKEYYKAADPNSKEYPDDLKAAEILYFYNMMETAINNRIQL